METNAPVRIGELLIHLGLLTESDLMEASHVAVDLGLPLGRALVMSDYISDEQLKAIIQAQSLLKDNAIDIATIATAMKLVGDSGCTFEEALAKTGYKESEDAARNKLGDLLVESSILKQVELTQALQQSQERGLPLGRILAATRALSATVLHACLNAQVLLRDGRITRAQAINALRAAHTKQTTLEQELADQGAYQAPSEARLRLGELFVMAGIFNEEVVLDVLEVCLLDQKMIGQVLTDRNIVTPKVLDAALKLQDSVDARALTPLTAGEALRRVFSRNISVERAMAEMGLLRSPSSERLRLGEFLVIAGAISQEQLQEAVKLSVMNNALIGRMLQINHAIDQRTLHNALRCQFMLREALLTEEQAVSLLQYCHRKQISVDEAMAETAADTEPSAVPAS